MVILPLAESSFARGCTTDSELIFIVWLPVNNAESAIVIDEEKLTGALGPDCTRGRTDCRLVEDDMAHDVNLPRWQIVYSYKVE